MPENASPLADIIRERIASGGPISVADYMAIALGHPDHGYYITRDPLGARGDFITAPEVSQMFGEMIGLWCVDIWSRTGVPGPLCLVELGPGRGTLMADLVRAAGVFPGFLDQASIHLVETSPVLKKAQANTLASLGQNAPPITWHETIDTLPQAPSLMIANEFFDALPVHHMVFSKGAWWERLVGVNDDGDFEFVLAKQPAPKHLIPSMPVSPEEGYIVETSPASLSIMQSLCGRLLQNGLAAIIIDYGFTRSTYGESLQALSNHGYADPLEEPGTRDLTAHVNFEALASIAAQCGLRVSGPIPQGPYLQQLGIETRAARLAHGQDDATVAGINHALRRLLSPDQMGSLFKVLAVASPAVPMPSGFEGM